MPWLLSTLMNNTCSRYAKSHPLSRGPGSHLHTEQAKEQLWPQLCCCAFRTNAQGPTQQNKSPQLPELGVIQQLISGQLRNQQSRLVLINCSR